MKVASCSQCKGQGKVQAVPLLFFFFSFFCPPKSPFLSVGGLA